MKTGFDYLRKTAAASMGACALLASCAVRPTKSDEEARCELRRKMKTTDVPSVLFIGNSYSFGVPKALVKFASAQGRQMDVGLCASSGWTLAKHLQNPETLQEIRRKHWDVVVLQEQSRLPTLPFQRTIWMIPPVKMLADEARKHGAIPVLYQTWGHRQGDPARKHDGFLAMTRRVRDGYRIAARKAGGLVIVPAGEAWQREFPINAANACFMADGRHPSAYGNSLTAGVFYETFFGK